jgi:hypothetical protein
MLQIASTIIGVTGSTATLWLTSIRNWAATGSGGKGSQGVPRSQLNGSARRVQTTFRIGRRQRQTVIEKELDLIDHVLQVRKLAADPIRVTGCQATRKGVANELEKQIVDDVARPTLHDLPSDNHTSPPCCLTEECYQTFSSSLLQMKARNGHERSEFIGKRKGGAA